MASARYLVTGGGGFIGSNIVEALLARGERVRVLDDFSTGHRKNLDGFDVELVEGSVADPEAAARACAGVEVVFHQGALPSVPRSVKEPLVSDRANTHGTLTMLEAARHAGVRRFLFAGSSSVYGETPELPKHEGMLPRPQSPYAVTKLAGEQYLAAYAILHGMETLTFRYFNVFGPRQDPNGAYAPVIARWGLAALAGEPLVVFGDGQQTRDFCFVANVVHANLLAADSAKKLGGEICNISCGEQITLLQLAEAIGAEAGRPITIRHDPPRNGDIRDSLAAIGRAKEVIGYEPIVRWREGLRRTMEALRREAARVRP
jgi:UDP-glucose 4-epimerase